MGPAKPRPSSMARRVGGGSNASAGGAVGSMEGTMLRQSCLMYTGAHTPPPPPPFFKKRVFFYLKRGNNHFFFFFCFFKKKKSSKKKKVFIYKK
jgi:hypothetical protein